VEQTRNTCGEPRSAANQGGREAQPQALKRPGATLWLTEVARATWPSSLQMRPVVPSDNTTVLNSGSVPATDCTRLIRSYEIHVGLRCIEVGSICSVF
jgi:hypothetical protein